MKITISIKGSGIRELSEAIAAAGDKRLLKAEVAALNEIGIAGKKKVLRALVKESGMDVDTIEKRGGFKHTPAYVGNPEFSLNATGGYTNLKDFDHRQTGKGVRSRAWGRSKLYGGSFINAGLHSLVMDRTGTFAKMKSGRYEGKRREKIKALFGPALPKVMLEQKIVDVFGNYVAEKLEPRVLAKIKAATKGVFD